jgi:hypothetical protein
MPAVELQTEELFSFGPDNDHFIEADVTVYMDYEPADPDVGLAVGYSFSYWEVAQLLWINDTGTLQKWWDDTEEFKRSKCGPLYKRVMDAIDKYVQDHLDECSSLAERADESLREQAMDAWLEKKRMER